MNPQPFKSQGEALHFLASTASAVPEVPRREPPAWRHPEAIRREAHYRARRGGEEALLYIGTVAECIADIVEVGDLWFADAKASLSAEAQFRALQRECEDAIRDGLAEVTFLGTIERAEEALWGLHAFVTEDHFWDGEG